MANNTFFLQNKKLFFCTALALVPIFLYYSLFLVFEPNNYFGLKKKADGTNVMATLREYEKTPQNHIILGDSRTAKFEPGIVKKASGNSYANLSYGGASFKEQLDILQWALAKNPNMQEVVFMASFYSFNKAYNHDRQVISALKNPFVYLTNLTYNINMLTNLFNHLNPAATVGSQGQSMAPENYEYIKTTVAGQDVTMRSIMALHVNELAKRSENWQLNTKEFERLLNIIDECTQKGIAFTVVLPPASQEVQKYVIQGFAIGAPMQKALETLQKTDALVLDYEIDPKVTLKDEQFYDGFHLDLVRGLPQWTEMLFADILSHQQKEV